MATSKQPTFARKCIVMIVVMVIARWVFDPSFKCDFTFDDHLAVVNNADVDTTRYFYSTLIFLLLFLLPSHPLPPKQTNRTAAKVLWQNDIWGKDLRKIDSHKSWRPLLIFSFRLSHAAQNGFNAEAFHYLGNKYLKKKLSPAISLYLRMTNV